MSDDDALRVRATMDEMVCFDIYSANLAFGRVYKPLLDPLGLTYPQFLVMMTLWITNGQSVGQIGDGVGLDSSTLTPLIKRLESAGFVSRQRDQRDERRVIVTLTPQGQALRERRDHVLACVTVQAGLDDAESRQLRDLLRRVGASLNPG